MKDIKVIFDGPYGNTRLDLLNQVEGKDLTVQKVLINIPTYKGSDKLYPNKGTSILQQFLGAVVVNKNAAQHIANFAALDTIYFINETDGLDVDDPEGLANLDLELFDYNAMTGVVRLSSVVYYPDNTKTEKIQSLNTDNG